MSLKIHYLNFDLWLYAFVKESGPEDQILYHCSDCDGDGETECCECGSSLDCETCDGTGSYSGTFEEFMLQFGIFDDGRFVKFSSDGNRIMESVYEEDYMVTCKEVANRMTDKRYDLVEWPEKETA